MLPFTNEEYQERLKKVKAAMSDKGIDVLLITDPCNMYYLTGYNLKSYYVNQTVLVALDDEMPRFIGRYMDATVGVLITTWLSKDHVHGYSDDYVDNTTKHAADYISGLIKEFGYGKKTIGIEMEHDFITPMAYERYKMGLPEAKIVNGSKIVNWVRLIKSDNEIEMMRRAGKITRKIWEACVQAFEPGARQCDVAAAVLEAATRGTEEYGGDYQSGPPLFPGGEHAGACHLTWDDSRYPDRYDMYMETGGAYKRYHCPVTRTMCLGQPSEKFVYTANAAIEGLQEALAVVKEGVTCEEVEAAWRKTVAKYGIEKESRIGYSVGIAYPPTWGEKTVSLRPGDKTVLKQNMTLHCIPGLYYEDFGITISETFRVTKTGHEKFYDIPFDLLIKK
ncbi:X-Pro dipeptidase [Paenibacillus beijingensis]|uniref:X-Pro dipeptidase n=2 Tax=Paenibacillus beijingensis TaxID=1126833 RepID=A0A0D5NRL9_9BACL|nr:X-Pro dipeptidase [Paenibacillus beijingensis]